MRRYFWLILMAGLLAMTSVEAQYAMRLKDNLFYAKPGDYIVTAQNKNYTLLMIYDKTSTNMTMEEVTVPENKIPKNISWKQWFQSGAAGNTSWIRYELNANTGKVLNTFSFTRNSWCRMAQADQFLSTLLNLQLVLIPPQERKKVGPSDASRKMDNRPIWQPRMIVDGQQIDNVEFDAWRTKWPVDDSPLSDKKIEVYLPEDSKLYPGYFPYWLQISGMVGQAKVRIVDSGKELQSPKAPLLVD